MSFDVSIDNVAAFDKATKRFLNKMGGDFEKKLRKIGLMVLRGTVLKTPVDTGLLRNNWQLDVGTMNSNILEGGSPEATTGEAVANLSKLQNNGIGQVIFIYNNVEYAVYIEFGTEKIAPSAMLRDTLGEVAISLA